MLFLQARAQRQVPADKTALIYAMEPVFAALFAWLRLSAALSLSAALWAAVVVLAVVLSQWKTARTESNIGPGCMRLHAASLSASLVKESAKKLSSDRPASRQKSRFAESTTIGAPQA